MKNNSTNFYLHGAAPGRSLERRQEPEGCGHPEQPGSPRQLRFLPSSLEATPRQAVMTAVWGMVDHSDEMVMP